MILSFLHPSSFPSCRPEDEEAVESFFPQASFHYLEGAGHWLHADRPTQFLDLVSPLLLP